MNYRPTDNQHRLLQQLSELNQLPRPILGSHDSLPNLAIQLPHQHPWVQLSYAAQGVLMVETAHTRLVAPPNRAVWIPPGLQHGVQHAANTCIRSIYVKPDAVPHRHCQVVEISALLRELIISFSRFPVEYDESGPQGRLAQVLLDELVAAPTCELVLPWPNDPRLTAVCQHLAAHPDCREPMAYFSQQLGISDKTLSRLFLHSTGMSFRHWRQRSRLLAALPLLEQGLRITDVALDCGYDSLSAFSAAFSELLGYTPREHTQRSTAPGHTNPGPR